MTHLVCVECGAKADVFSEKDDLDYPGEEEYVRRLGEGWGLNLKIVKPDLSPAEFVRQHASEMVVADDIHGRSAKLSKTCFYGIVERANAGYDAVMLGLRTGESKERLRLRASRGRYFELASGQRRVLPIADWTGLDVFAYVVSREIELLPVYRCIGFMHAQEPWRLRKSWWLPGSSAAHGQVAWLRRYYPSLYRQMCDWMPGTSMLG
jgi:3'-phosphoadenosine 5'-phosphosulfate sulfotransferase (PAPS reductase)/FAD synthetase